MKGLKKDDFTAKLDKSIKKFLYKRIVCDAMEMQVGRNLAQHNVNIFKGEANFEDEHQIRIVGGKEVIYGEKIIIATGSYPYHPEIFHLTEIEYTTRTRSSV